MAQIRKMFSYKDCETVMRSDATFQFEETDKHAVNLHQHSWKLHNSNIAAKHSNDDISHVVLVSFDVSNSLCGHIGSCHLWEYDFIHQATELIGMQNLTDYNSRLW